VSAHSTLLARKASASLNGSTVSGFNPLTRAVYSATRLRSASEPFSGGASWIAFSS
jgi:hypothetical protein